MSELSKRFIEGLKEYNLSKEDVENFIYIGGDEDDYRKHLHFNGYDPLDMPKKKDQCLCGHDIKINCYIKSKEGSLILVLGSCCVKRFIKSGLKKTCEKCGNNHKNRKYNICNECKKKLSKIEEDYLILQMERRRINLFEDLPEEVKIKKSKYHKVNVIISKKTYMNTPFINIDVTTLKDMLFIKYDFKDEYDKIMWYYFQKYLNRKLN